MSAVGHAAAYYDHMIWVAPSEKESADAALEKRDWSAADQFLAIAGLKSQKYSAAVLLLSGQVNLNENKLCPPIQTQSAV